MTQDTMTNTQAIVIPTARALLHARRNLNLLACTAIALAQGLPNPMPNTQAIVIPTARVLLHARRNLNLLGCLAIALAQGLPRERRAIKTSRVPCCL